MWTSSLFIADYNDIFNFVGFAPSEEIFCSLFTISVWNRSWRGSPPRPIPGDYRTRRTFASLFAPETGDSFLHDISHVTSSGKDHSFVRTRAFDDKPNAIYASNFCISANVSFNGRFYLLCVCLTDLNASNPTFIGESPRDCVKPLP